jgi:hypothetical protein
MTAIHDSKWDWLQRRHIEGCTGNKILPIVFATSLTVSTKTILYGKSFELI